jgi:hypothetical protein
MMMKEGFPNFFNLKDYTQRPVFHSVHEMREYVTIDPYENVLGWNRTEQGEWWFWKNKPANAGQMEDCCVI